MPPRRPVTDLSLRDPDGAVRIENGRVLRLIFPQAAARFAEMLSADIVQSMITEGDIVATWPASSADWPSHSGDAYEHELAPFPSQPREWSPAMLASAAEFTIGIARRLLPHGLMLKDATPGNIQFFGSKPVLVDVPSIVRRPRGSFMWPARQQFESTFLLPLIANLERRVPLRWSLENAVDGITHEFCAGLIGARRWLQPSLWSSVALPAMLNAAMSASSTALTEKTMPNDDKALFILQRSIDGLMRRTRKLAAQLESRTSHWNSYQGSRTHYDAEDLKRKMAFVDSSLASANPASVLDVGANTGEFSVAAARYASVVALESDDVAASSIFRRAQRGGLAIHPLVVDFARPTPASGWRNAEQTAFLSRATGSFDMVVMLAVIHHLRVTGGIPVVALIDAAWSIARDFLLVEFVPRSDPMFRQIARGREALYEDCERDEFTACLSARFAVQASETLANGRTLFLARRRSV